MTTTEMRRCIGGGKFGIGAHEAPVEDSPRSPARRMSWGGCAGRAGTPTRRPKAAVERKAHEAAVEEAPADPEAAELPEEGSAPEPPKPKVRAALDGMR